jgi:hypothetical protein
VTFSKTTVVAFVQAFVPEGLGRLTFVVAYAIPLSVWVPLPPVGVPGSAGAPGSMGGTLPEIPVHTA